MCPSGFNCAQIPTVRAFWLFQAPVIEIRKTSMPPQPHIRRSRRSSGLNRWKSTLNVWMSHQLEVSRPRLEKESGGFVTCWNLFAVASEVLSMISSPPLLHARAVDPSGWNSFEVLITVIVRYEARVTHTRACSHCFDILALHCIYEAASATSQPGRGP